MKTKRRLYSATEVLALGLIATSCTSFGKIEVRNDEFKNASVVTLKLKFTSEETFLPLNPYRGEMQYVREVGEETIKPVLINLTFKAPTDSDPLEATSFLKAGDQQFEIALSGVESLFETHTHANTRTTKYHTPDASGFVDFTKPAAVDSQTTYHSYSFREFKAQIQLTESHERSILASKRVAVRVYAGTEPITFLIIEDDLAKLKRMIQTDPGNSQPAG